MYKNGELRRIYKYCFFLSYHMWRIDRRGDGWFSSEYTDDIFRSVCEYIAERYFSEERTGLLWHVCIPRTMCTRRLFLIVKCNIILRHCAREDSRLEISWLIVRGRWDERIMTARISSLYMHASKDGKTLC